MGNPKFKEQMARIGVLHGENPVMANCLVVTSYEPGASDCAHAGGALAGAAGRAAVKNGRAVLSAD